MRICRAVIELLYSCPFIDACHKVVSKSSYNDSVTVAKSSLRSNIFTESSKSRLKIIFSRQKVVTRHNSSLQSSHQDVIWRLWNALKVVMKSSQSVHKIVCWRLSGLHKIVTWHKNSSQISQSAVTWPPGYFHKVVTLSKNTSQKRHLTTYDLSQISHRTIIWRFEVCHSVVLRW